MSTRVPPHRLLPSFPWDGLAAARERANSHPDGVVDLSVGTPVDPVDPVIRGALADASAVPGYPTTAGTPELRAAIHESAARRYGMTDIDPAGVLPVIGTKELIAGLPAQLGLGASSVVQIPELAYPTYEVGALLVGARIVRSDAVDKAAEPPTLLYLNSPANPSGRILDVAELRSIVAQARAAGTIVVSDECYLGLAWDAAAPSVLDPRVSAGDHTNLLAVHSLSKTSNLASYRAGYVAGDPHLVRDLLEVRRHSGLMVPYPIQAAMVAALSHDEHERQQRARYAHRRAVLSAAVRAAGLRIEHSEGGLYLWATRGENGRHTVDWLAELGILVAPGDFYGPAGTDYVRIALTASDERIAAAASRLGEVDSADAAARINSTVPAVTLRSE